MSSELRNGVEKLPAVSTDSPDTVRAMSLDMFFDYLGVRLNGPSALGKTAKINFILTDTSEKYLVTLKNSVLNYSKGKQAKDADCTLTLSRTTLNEIILGEVTLPKALTDGNARIEGDAKALQTVLTSLDSFEFWFDIVTANPPPK